MRTSMPTPPGTIQRLPAPCAMPAGPRESARSCASIVRVTCAKRASIRPARAPALCPAATNQTPPAPGASPVAARPVETVRATAPARASTRDTVPSSRFATHSDPAAAVTASGRAPTGTLPTTRFVRGSISTSVLPRATKEEPPPLPRPSAKTAIDTAPATRHASAAPTRARRRGTPAATGGGLAGVGASSAGS